jgi:transposase-like protein
MRKHDIDKMRRLYEAWESSGTSMKAFSLENNINPATFNYWAKTIRNERQQLQPSSFIQLAAPNCAPVGTVAASITFPSGAKLDLHGSIQASLIKELVG